jgi:hypothetical protein
MSAKSTKTKARRAKRVTGPSKASLQAIPPLDERTAITFGRGPEGLRKALEWARARRGRPRDGDAPEGSRVKSVRFSDRLWDELERTAKKRGVSVHAAMREAIVKWLAA